MATESSEPRNKVIIIVALVSIVTLMGSRSLLISYFDQYMGAELHEKVLAHPAEQLIRLHLDEAKHFATANMPLQKAIDVYVTRGRSGLGDTVEPKASDDSAPLVGWTQRPMPFVKESAPKSAPAEPAKP